MKEQKAKSKKIAARSVKRSKSSSPAQKAKASRASGAIPKAAGTNSQHVQAILQKLDEAYPNVTCALEHHTAFQLLISTILSAQCTDERVNRVTPGLFREIPDIAAMASAPPERIERLIVTTGFFRHKTKSLQGAAHRSSNASAVRCLERWKSW